MNITIAYWCVLIATLLPLTCSWMAKAPGIGKRRRDGGFDNRDPRAWLARQEGWARRANAAQANGFEGLPFFIGAVIIAHQLGANQGWLDLLAAFYVALRLGYIAAYLVDWHWTRSAVWGLALLVNIAIFLLGC